LKKLSIISFFTVVLFCISCRKNKPDVINNNNTHTDTIHTSPLQLFEYLILPSATNSAINTYNNAHEVLIDTRTVLQNKLFVFLPGTTGMPTAYKLIVKKAASLGYHSIGLMYPNSADIYTAAANSTDNSLFGKCRQEIFDGIDHTSGVSVDQNNCIQNRLLQLLLYLKNHYPTQHWEQFLPNNEIDWSKIIIAGHSQGGGHAFYIAKKVAVAKAIAFSSIDWNSSLGMSADWIFQTGATPINKYFSFNALKDQIFSYTNVVTQLNDLGLQGTAISIDTNNPPYNNTHTLTTNATPAFNLLFPDHNITSLDTYVPKDVLGNESSSFANAWEYLLTQ